jgi:hypothetical protein
VAATSRGGGSEPDPEYWKRLSKKLPGRTWNDLRESWLGFLPPEFVERSPVLGSVSDLPDVRRMVERARDTKLVQSEDIEIPGLRASILAEGLELMHRAFHVLGSAHVQVQNGFCTWSASSSYHAAFFAMRSILRLLGIVDFVVGKDSFVLDCWAGESQRGKSRLGDYQTLVVPARRIEHRQQWFILQRMLRVTKVEPWPADIVGTLVDCKETDFSRQRNAIHYGKTEWPGPDLFRPILQASYGDLVSDRALKLADPNGIDFSSALGITLSQMALALLVDLASVAPDLSADITSISAWIGRCSMPSLS